MAEPGLRKSSPALSFVILDEDLKLDDEVGNRAPPKNAILKTSSDWKEERMREVRVCGEGAGLVYCVPEA